MPVTVRHCIWCNSQMNCKRADKLVCSRKCENEMSYVRRRDFSHLSKDEFREVLNNYIAQGSHLNPNHPLAQYDRALALAWESLTELLKAASVIEQERQLLERGAINGE